MCAQRSSKNGHILVVDDSELVVDLVANALAALGWTVSGDTQPERALARLAEDHTIEVLICDLHMPEMEGLEVIKHAKALRPLVPAIILSSDQELDAVLHAMRKGAFDYVLKSDDLKSPIGAAVERAVHHHRILLENEALRLELAASLEQVEASRDQALTATRTKSAFLAGMSHELRTPLNAILNYAEMIAEDAEDEGRTELLSDIRRIHSSGQRLLGLIDDIFEFARLDTGHVDIDPQPIALNTFCQEVFSRVEHHALDQNNQFVLELPDQPCKLNSDSRKIRQILRNLLDNANKFTRNGLITLRLSRDPDAPRVRFSVEDTGIGMKPEQLEHIFDPFTQAEAGLARSHVGAGLGLTLTHQLCQLLGGEIKALSTLGKGTCFTVTLPDFASSER